MPTMTVNGQTTWQHRTTKARLIGWFSWLLTVSAIVYCWQVLNRDTIWSFVVDAPAQFADLFARMANPRWAYMSELWRPLWDTLSIATLGTMCAVVLAVPVAFCAARNTTPNRFFVRPIALLAIVTSRSVNSLIWGLLLVAILGPGVLAGIIAIALRSVGFVSKLTYEAIEEIDAKQVEAIRATGASGPQILTYGILPQIMPSIAGVSVFRWDINIRESTVLGLVGAGGIGLQLQASVNSLAWNQVGLILLLILTSVLISEWVSAKVRHALL